MSFNDPIEQVISVWRVKTENVQNKLCDQITNDMLLWSSSYGTEYPHDIDVAIDRYNASTSRNRIEFDAKIGYLACKAIVYPEHTNELVKEHPNDGYPYCDNCCTQLTNETRLLKWENLKDCICAFVCSDECREIVDHRTGSCDCMSMSTCRATFEHWLSKRPNTKLFETPVYDCICDYL